VPWPASAPCSWLRSRSICSSALTRCVASKSSPSEGQTNAMLLALDADDVMCSRARKGAGKWLARLLRVSDGNSGVYAMILITTYEPLGRLH
jgi:hypothetical protein